MVKTKNMKFIIDTEEKTIIVLEDRVNLKDVWDEIDELGIDVDEFDVLMEKEKCIPQDSTYPPEIYPWAPFYPSYPFPTYPPMVTYTILSNEKDWCCNTMH